MVLGIPDFWIWSAYLLCIASTLLCVAYGLFRWNKDGENESQQVAEEGKWEINEQEAVKKL